MLAECMTNENHSSLPTHGAFLGDFFPSGIVKSHNSNTLLEES